MRSGQLEEARALLLLSAETGSNDYLQEPLRRVMVHERLGEVYEALGDSALAAQHYGLFAEHWADADPAVQGRVEAAREKAAALARTVGAASEGS